MRSVPWSILRRRNPTRLPGSRRVRATLPEVMRMTTPPASSHAHAASPVTHVSLMEVRGVQGGVAAPRSVAEGDELRIPPGSYAGLLCGAPMRGSYAGLLCGAPMRGSWDAPKERAREE